MYRECNIRPPFFEVGPKAYIYGAQMLAFAKELDSIAIEYDVDIILTPQYTDIKPLADTVKRLHIFAQHMDYLPVGRGLGSVLPEAVKAAGATGVMLNHAEKKLTLESIELTIKRADEVGLSTIVCADTEQEIRAIAAMAPNIIVAEPTNLIGTGKASSMDYVKRSIETVKSVNKDILVLQGAGISSGSDVYNVIAAGAEATGSTSGILKAADPVKMAKEMIFSLRRAWDERHKKA